jgi:rhodanese-related sulfurtransferase
MDRVEKSVFTASMTTTGTSNNGMMSNNNTTNNSNNTTSTMTLMGLVIYGKDNGRQIRFTTPSYADTIRAHEALQNYAFPGRRNLGYLFAFESKKENVINSIVVDPTTGQKKVTLPADRQRFDAVAEFQRQLYGRHDGSNNYRARAAIIQPWTIYTQMNAPQYQLCQSYPSILAGPASLDETKPEHARILQQSAAFRSEGRLPALTWASGRNGGSLWRASQPKVGLQGNRSFADEMLLKHIREQAAAANALSVSSSSSPDGHGGSGGPPVLSRQMLVQLTGSPDVQNWLPSNSSSSSSSNNGTGGSSAAGVGNELKILDLRPRSSALGNRTGGYGYENTSHYTGTTLQFCNIGNIHAVRDAYQKISTLCTNPNTQDVQWNALVEDTKWLSQIRLILAASWEAAFWIHVHHLPVLLHCSHGWDRTSQVAVLCQLLLDPSIGHDKVLRVWWKRIL